MIRATLLALTLVACGGELAPEPGEELSGGGVTVFDTSRDAFSRPAPGLARDDERAFFRGRAVFRDAWVTAPSSTTTRDGLGPLFNANSCEGCHARDGRGRPPEAGDPMVSMLVRLSIPGVDASGGPLGEPSYGGQLQPLAIDGVAAEGQATVVFEEIEGTYGDGETYRLRRPAYAFTELAYGELAANVLLSPRTTPAMIGLGLLEAVPEEALVALADPEDADDDGISGRTNQVWDMESGSLRRGRFGWKANQPSLRQQAAGAFVGDLGMTSTLFPAQDCSPAELDCLAATTGGEPEVIDAFLDDVVLYSRLLAVPARREWDDPEVLRGKQLFAEAGCASCHTPVMQTSADAAPSVLAGQTIRAYTDLLLHDMGEELADGRPDFLASGSEWRTPPLWGLGLLNVVNGHLMLLHDGRARGVAEAILWHGGEGSVAREAFRAMAAGDRAALVRFVESL